MTPTRESKELCLSGLVRDRYGTVVKVGFELREGSTGVEMQYFLPCSLRRDAR